jgi:hypothetical protein
MAAEKLTGKIVSVEKAEPAHTVLEAVALLQDFNPSRIGDGPGRKLGL